MAYRRETLHGSKQRKVMIETNISHKKK